MMITKPAKGTSPKSKSPRVPRFSSVQEEAAFWETHSVADYEDDLEEVQDVVFVRHAQKRGMTVRLEPDVLILLGREAREQGIGPSTLARMIILGYLKDSGRGTILRKGSPKKRTPAPRKRSKGAA